MKAKEFDHKFEQGEDITPYLNLNQAKRSLKQLKHTEGINSPLQTPRSLGLLKGKLGEAFFDPLPEEELQLWLSASEVSDKKIWGHPHEERYNELL